jgi:putative spermidine/putrescine transport system permease protein
VTARLLRGGLYAVNALAVGLLLIPLCTSLLVSFSPSEYVALPTDDLSLRWYREFFGDPRWTVALANSLGVALLTMAISFPLGLLAALAFARHRGRGRGIVSALIVLPLFVPSVVLGIGSLAFHRAVGLWGTPISLAIAHSLWAVPLVFLVLRAALAGIDPALEEAAATQGASPARVLWHVTLPLVAPGVLVALLFAFIISVNEFIMALFLATPRTRTLPVVIWPQIRYLLTPVVAAASSVIIVLTVAVLAAAARLTNVRRLLETS